MKALIYILLATCLVSCNQHQAPEVNVVTIILDDATQAQIERGMPNFMEEIHSRATHYQSGVFDISLCGPSTANYLTGRIGRETGMTNCNPNENLPNTSEGHGVIHNGANGLETGGVGAFDFRHTLLTEMQNAGYRVGWFGKYLNGYKGNSISTAINNKPAVIHYKDVDARVWKFAGQFDYQPVPPGVDTWRAEYDHSIEPGIFHFKINSADGGSVGKDEHWHESLNYDPNQKQAEHIEYFKQEVARYLRINKGRKKFLTLRLFNPHISQLEGVLPYVNSCDRRQALAHPSQRHKGTVDPMSIPLPLSLTEFLKTVSPSTEPEPQDGLIRFPCGTQDGMTHQQMYEMYYRFATASTIEALSDYDDLVKEVIDQLKRDKEFDNTMFVLFNDNGIMNGEHGLFHKNKPWRESIALHLVIKYPNQEKAQTVVNHVSNTAITPTILDVAGVESQMPMHSQSLRNIGKQTPNEKILSEGYVRLCKQWEFEQASDGNYSYFIQYFPNKAPKEFFFDWRQDPAELVNLANTPEHQDLIKEFRQFLQSFPGGPLNTEPDIAQYRNQCH